MDGGRQRWSPWRIMGLGVLVAAVAYLVASALIPDLGPGYLPWIQRRELAARLVAITAGATVMLLCWWVQGRRGRVGRKSLRDLLE